VKEFTELQGIVGGLYARVQNLDEHLPEEAQQAIATAIYDHYKPESMEDAVPRTVEGAVLSIGDKADSIAGMFALGLIPSGSKDPFALRRQANGIVKMIAEYKLPIPLTQLFVDARETYRGSEAEKKFSAKVDFPKAISDFFRERLEFYLRDVLGFRYDVANAVLAVGTNDVVDAVARAKAVAEVRPSPNFESIAIAFKRIKNILKQAEEKGFDIPTSQERSLMGPSEMELDEQVRLSGVAFNLNVDQGNYEAALVSLVEIRPALEEFFEKVMVMDEDPQVRGNRLNLLSLLNKIFRRVADFSEIVTEGKS
jgi:glycyl-tRNA synthetase beta chain